MKMTKIFLALLAPAVFLAGCNKRMTLGDTFMVPRIGGEPEQIFYYRFALPEFLDVTDTTLLFDKGVSEPSLSWKAVIFQKTATAGKYERVELFATRDIFEPRAFLGIKIPDTIQIGDDDMVVVLDHEERLIFNAAGKFMEADYKSVNLIKYDDFFTKVSDLEKVVYEKGSVEYEKLIKFSRDLHAVELTRAANTIRERLGVLAGSALTKEQLEFIRDKGWDKLFESLLYDNWYILFAYPIMSPEKTGTYIMVNKLFQIPTYWLRDENGPGRMRRTMTASDTYFMMKWWQSRGAQAVSAPEKKAVNHPLSEKSKAALKGTPCEAAGTVEEFNDCAAESFAEQYKEKK